MLRNLIALIFTIVWLSGCAAPSQVSATADDMPAWVLNPARPGYISVVGAAPKQDWGGRSAQHRVAEMKARQELAQMVTVRIESTNRYSTTVGGDGVSRTADIDTKLQSATDLSLASARVVEEWTDPKSGELYILLATPE
jgi:hypothetical protein